MKGSDIFFTSIKSALIVLALMLTIGFQEAKSQCAEVLNCAGASRPPRKPGRSKPNVPRPEVKTPTAPKKSGSAGTGGRGPKKKTESKSNNRPVKVPTTTAGNDGAVRPRRGVGGGKTPPKLSPTYALQVSVNEGLSTVVVEDVGGKRNWGVELTTDTDGKVELSDLVAGKYSVEVTKKGYGSQKQNINIIGKKRSVGVDFELSPLFASLSVATDVDDATIEVEGVGFFQGSIARLPVDTGEYTIRAFKNGYSVAERKVDLSQPGSVSNITLNLSPVSVADLVQQSERLLAAGLIPESTRLIKKVLTFDPENSKANALAAEAAFKGEVPTESVHRYAEAIRLGHTVTMAVNRYVTDSKGAGRMLPGMLWVSQDFISFRADDVVNLNFDMNRAGLASLLNGFDQANMSYTRIAGRGSFGGRQGTQDIILYPGSAKMSPNQTVTYCAVCPSGRECVCDSEHVVLYEVLNSWTSTRETGPSQLTGVPAYPSEDFEEHVFTGFGLKLPKNWKASDDGSQIIGFPAGGAKLERGKIAVTHGMSARIEENVSGDVDSQLQYFASSVIKDRSYLSIVKGAEFPVKDKSVTSYIATGVSPLTKRRETVVIYGMPISESRTFVMTLTFPSEDESAYKPFANRMLYWVAIK